MKDTHQNAKQRLGQRRSGSATSCAAGVCEFPFDAWRGAHRFYHPALRVQAAGTLDLLGLALVGDFLLRGLLSNMQERAFAAEEWPELCPVSFSIPGGFLVEMPARPPADGRGRAAFDYRAFVTRGDSYVDENFARYACGSAPR